MSCALKMICRRNVWFKPFGGTNAFNAANSKTADGENIRVLHPGVTNAEGGPDFPGAVIQFGNEKPRAGDVVIDVHASRWRAHGHVNVILPWHWIRAVEGGNEKIQRKVEQRFFTRPTAEGNSVLKLARQRQVGISRSHAPNSAAAQQRLMQIVRDFCEPSNAICENCRFPELVRSWRTEN